MKWKTELELAKKAAVEAGKYLLKASGRKRIIDDSGRDIKHQSDLKSERIILDILKIESPYPILTEESGVQGKIKSNSILWIVDPLDGTFNYTRGIPMCCVSIALWQEDSPILGVIHDFNRNEMFYGVVNKGAWCNGKPISASNLKNPRKAVLATGFPVNRDFSSFAIKTFINQIKNFKKIRHFGSAAISLAYVASGRVDAYTEESIMLWDVAAGIAIIVAGGGYVLVKDARSKRWAKNVMAGCVFLREGQKS